MSFSSLPFSFVGALEIYACYGEEITSYNVRKIDKVCFGIIFFILQISLNDWLIPLSTNSV